MKRTTLITASLLLLDLGGCVFPDKQIGDGDDEFGEDTGPESESDADEGPDADTGEDESSVGEETGPFDECEGPFPGPEYDQDCDAAGLGCDNDNDHHNPNQLDQDGDQFGDVGDLCPLLSAGSNTADSDRDGLGNACDRCPKPTDVYNESFGPEVPTRMHVRNVPNHHDFDQDGVGDVCDNCPTVPNCSIYGTDEPAPYGIETDDLPSCQLDEDQNGIGDECEVELPPPPSSAGPIGFSTTDDFDQDGLTNLEDACPRQPNLPVVCLSDEDCGSGTQCAVTASLGGARYCNHRDIDSDLVGDVCDTCPSTPNPLQVTDGGMQVDDEDGDFIGADCEASVACSIVDEPRPTGFFNAVVASECCVTTYPGDDVLHDPDGKPIRLDCTSEQEEDGVCRKLPASVAAMPGVVELPVGCEEALAEAGLDEAPPLTLADFDGDPMLLTNYACLLPPWDQDFDGVGDACDLCPFAFDPLNEPYVDDMGMLWPDFGKACSGDYATDLVPGAACEWP
jgi:hypothetical protein